MKILRKLIAVVAATAMVLSNVVSVSALMNFTGIHFTSCFDAYGDASSNKNTYYIASGNGTVTTLTYAGTSVKCIAGVKNDSRVELRQHVLSTSGERAISIRPQGTSKQDDGRLGAAYIKFNIPQKAESNEYHISFNAMIKDLENQYKEEARVYMNWDGHDSDRTSLLYCLNNPGSGLWTATPIGTGAENGGVGDHPWYRYTGTIVAGNDTNELRFSAHGWNVLHIDDIVVTDKYGTVIFSEDFEYGAPESDLTRRWTYDGGGKVDFKIIPQHTAGDGEHITATDLSNHVLSVVSRDGGVGKYYIDVPTVPDNTYTLSYEKYNSFNYAKAQINTAVAVGMVDGVWGDMNIGSGTGTVTKTFNSSGNSRLRIVAEGWGEVYLDNICLKDKYGTIVFFENFEEYEEEFDEELGVGAQFAPENLIASQGAEHIMLSWRNPANGGLSKVSLYDITSGGNTLISDSISATANAYVNYDVTGLTAASKHTYKIVYQFGDVVSTESIISAIASNKRDSNILGVGLTGNHPGTSVMEHNDVHAGTSAVRVISNLPSWTSNNYIRVQTPQVSFSSSKAYEISLWIKGRFAGSSPIPQGYFKDLVKNGNPSTFKFDGSTATFTAVETDENGWQHVKFQINGQGATQITFMGENKTDMLIDDIEVWEIDDSGNHVGETALYTENFESTSARVADVAYVSTKVTNGAAKIIYKAPAKADKVRIYAKDGEGNLSKRAEVFKEDLYVILKNLKNDNEYTYVIKAVDALNNESAGVEVNVTPTEEENPNFYGEEVIDAYGEGEIVAYKDGWEQEGDVKRTFTITEQTNGNHRLRIYGKDGLQGSGHIGTYKISLPKRSSTGEYHITYDIELAEGKTKTSASLDVTGSSIYSSGHQLTNEGGEHVVSGSGNYLIFAAEGWANAYVDNIVVKDASGTVLFTEDFENFDEKYTYYVDNSKLQGLSANGIDDIIYLSWRNPNRNDIESIKIYEDGIETTESQLYSITCIPEEVNIIEMSSNFIGTGNIHEYDVRMATENGMVYHNYITASENERFVSKARTKDGMALQGWRLAAADGTNVKGLGSVYYDTLNKQEGNASLHINPNITRISSEQQYDTNRTHVITTYQDGEGRANFYLEALAYGINSTGTYKLSFKQKGHYAPAYHIYYVDSSAKSIGALTGQNGYTNYAAWQSREIEFTIDSTPSGQAKIRFDFSNGCDDFWLDDVRLVKVGGDGTNYIANGNFEHGISNLQKSENNATWTLADSNDIVKVYKKVGDSLIDLATLSKGATSYRIPAFDGTKETLVFKTVKKSGTNEFLSEEFPLDLTQESSIYSATFEVVDENLEAIGTPETLTGDILLKTSLKIENASSIGTGADLYTMIYKNGILLNVDKQTVATNTGTINCSSIMKVPSVADGDYSASVFVWSLNGFRPLKNAETLDE